MPYLFVFKLLWNSLKQDNASISRMMITQLQPHLLLLAAWMLFSRLLYYHMTEWTYGYSIVKMIDTEVSLHAPCRAISHVENRARAYVLLAFSLRRMYQEMCYFLSTFCQLIMAWFRVWVSLEKWQKKLGILVRSVGGFEKR